MKNSDNPNIKIVKQNDANNAFVSKFTKEEAILLAKKAKRIDWFKKVK
jgi:hypothetical protein